jgi:hypothetical protein
MAKKHTFKATILDAGGGGAFMETKNSEFLKNSEFCFMPLLFLPSPHPK